VGGATQPCFTPTETGNYNVVVITTLGCVSAPSAPVQVISTAVPEHPADLPRVVPNPTTGLVALTFGDARIRNILVCDAQGRVVRQSRSSGAQVVVDLQAQPTGLYLLRGMQEAWTVRVVRE